MSYRKLYPQILAFALIFAVGCASPAPEEAAPAEPAAEPAAEAAAEKIVAPVQPNVVKQVEKLPAQAAPALDSAMLLCDLSGPVGTKVLCPVKVASANSDNPATAFQLTLSFDDSKLALNKITCTNPAGVDTCAAGALPTGHSLAWNPKTGSKDGKVSVIAFHASSPDKSLNSAVIRDGGVEGDTALFSAEFEIKAAADESAPLSVSMVKVMGADAKANKLGAQLKDAVVVLSAP